MRLETAQMGFTEVLSIDLFIYLSIYCLSICIPIYLYSTALMRLEMAQMGFTEVIYLSSHLSIYWLSIYLLFICSIYIGLTLNPNLPIYLSIYCLSIYIHIYLYAIELMRLEMAQMGFTEVRPLGFNPGKMRKASPLPSLFSQILSTHSYSTAAEHSLLSPGPHVRTLLYGRLLRQDAQSGTSVNRLPPFVSYILETHTRSTQTFQSAITILCADCCMAQELNGSYQLRAHANQRE